MKKGYFRSFAALLFTLVSMFLVSCSGNEELSYKEEPVENIQYDWRGNGFRPMDKEQEAFLYLTDFKNLKKDNINVNCGSNSFYGLSHKEGESIYELCSRMGTEEKSIFSFDILDWEIERPYLFDYHVYQDSTAVFYVMDKEAADVINSPIAHYYMVFTDSNGNLVKKIDVLPKLTENRICKSYDYRCRDISQDVNGYHYFWDNSNSTILVLDSDGETVFCECLTDPFPKEQIECMKTSEDEVVFIRSCSKGVRFILPDFQALRFVQVFDIEQRNLQKWQGIWGNTVYYSQSNKLKTWNIETGEVRIILDESEYSLNYLSTEIEPVSGGIDIYYHEGTKLNYYMFRDEEPVKENSITVANFCREDDYLKRCSNCYGIENPNIGIGYEDCHADSAKADRMMMDIMRGDGPDIMYVSREDMENLAGHYALADLSEMISKENLDCIYPAAINAGKIDDKLVSLPLHVVMDALVVTDRYVTDSSWTTEDVIRIVSEHDEELEGIFLWDAYQAYKVNLKILLGADIFDSEFIHDGKADFENEHFKDLLRLIKRKTDINNWNPQNRFELVQEGKHLGLYETYMLDFVSYCSINNKLGSGMHVMGLPGDNGRKIPLEIEGYIVVNRNSCNKAEVADFIDYLFSFEAQCMILDCGEYSSPGASVRKDMLERNIEEFDGDYVMLLRSYGNLVYVGLMPTSAGELPIEDYESLWDDAFCPDSAQEKIMDMIIEEADGYFLSDKDLDAVVKSINKRVQIYLDERE